MKVERIICPKCNLEKREISDEDNLHGYSEEIVYKKCPEHPDTPEDKLLRAIFGEKE